MVGAIVATSHDVAKRAALIVRIDYEELDSVVTIKVIQKYCCYQQGDITAMWKSGNERP